MLGFRIQFYEPLRKHLGKQYDKKKFVGSKIDVHQLCQETYILMHLCQHTVDNMTSCEEPCILNFLSTREPSHIGKGSVRWGISLMSSFFHINTNFHTPHPRRWFGSILPMNHALVTDLGLKDYLVDISVRHNQFYLVH